MAGGLAVKGPRSAGEMVIVVAVTPVTIVPGAIRPATGVSVMPVAIPLVFPEGNLRVVGADVGVPDVGVSGKKAYGGFNVKVTDAGEPDRACETVTLVEVTAATVVPGAMVGSPETAIPTVTPLVFAKCRIWGRSVPVTGFPSRLVAAALVGSENEMAVAVVGALLGD